MTNVSIESYLTDLPGRIAHCRAIGAATKQVGEPLRFGEFTRTRDRMLKEARRAEHELARRRRREESAQLILAVPVIRGVREACDACRRVNDHDEPGFVCALVDVTDSRSPARFSLNADGSIQEDRSAW